MPSLRERLRAAIFVEVREGERIPRGYGLTYRQWDRNTATAALIPLNLLIGLGRRVWHSCKQGNPRAFWDTLSRARQAGYDQGFAECSQGARREVEAAYERGMRTALIINAVVS